MFCLRKLNFVSGGCGIEIGIFFMEKFIVHIKNEMFAAAETELMFVFSIVSLVCVFVTF